MKFLNYWYQRMTRTVSNTSHSGMSRFGFTQLNTCCAKSMLDERLLTGRGKRWCFILPQQH